MATAVRSVDEGPVAVLREANATRPEVRLTRLNDAMVVIKDYGGGGWVLKLLGLFLLPRERRAYERLQGLTGVPTYLGSTRYSITTEYLESIAAHAAGPNVLTPRFFQRLRELIAAMHARGVAHGDLKRLDNIRVTPEGEPVIIDFCAAFLSGSSPAAALALPHMMDEDMRAMYKIKRRRVPHLLTEEEEHLLDMPRWRATVVRCLMAAIRKSVRTLALREHDHDV